MSNADLIKEITTAFSNNRTDQAVIDKNFAPGFRYWSNGKQGDLAGYRAALAEYEKDYDRFTISRWDELFEAHDKVVAAYRLDGAKKSGGNDSMNVMAVWQVKDGKVASLRQVLAKP
jgi:ketosteroid isomerase-like protein